MSPPSGSSPIFEAAAAPCALPKVWPPAISATVSSSFIAMRPKRFANVARRGDRIGIAVRAFRVHIDEAHLHGRQRILEIPLAGSSASPHPSHCVSVPQYTS